MKSKPVDTKVIIKLGFPFFITEDTYIDHEDEEEKISGLLGRFTYLNPIKYIKYLFKEKVIYYKHK